MIRQIAAETHCPRRGKQARARYRQIPCPAHATVERQRVRRIDDPLLAVLQDQRCVDGERTAPASISMPVAVLLLIVVPKSVRVLPPMVIAPPHGVPNAADGRGGRQRRL